MPGSLPATPIAGLHAGVGFVEPGEFGPPPGAALGALEARLEEAEEGEEKEALIQAIEEVKRATAGSSGPKARIEVTQTGLWAGASPGEGLRPGTVHHGADPSHHAVGRVPDVIRDGDAQRLGSSWSREHRQLHGDQPGYLDAICRPRMGPNELAGSPYRSHSAADMLPQGRGEEDGNLDHSFWGRGDCCINYYYTWTGAEVTAAWGGEEVIVSPRSVAACGSFYCV